MSVDLEYRISTLESQLSELRALFETLALALYVLAEGAGLDMRKALAQNGTSKTPETFGDN